MIELGMLAVIQIPRVRDVTDNSSQPVSPDDPENDLELEVIESDTPHETLDHIRQKMESVAAEFSAGKINRAQFNAIYGHYSEKRAIIEKLIQRNPQNEAWKQVAKAGHTTFLRSHFEAQPVYYVVFRHHQRQPLISGGAQPPNSMGQIVAVLKQLWAMKTLPPVALARKPLDAGLWLVVAVGQHAVTIVIFSLQPSNAQADLVRDLHSDFERANRLSLQRDLGVEMMVFPQRSLLK